MRDISKGLKYYNYISSQTVKKIFKGLPFELKIKNVIANGQKKGCSGFITNTETGKICYITTEPFFDGRGGSGLWGNNKKAVMMRTAESTTDYRGGINYFTSPEKIVQMAERLTAAGGIGI